MKMLSAPVCTRGGAPRRTSQAQCGNHPATTAHHNHPPGEGAWGKGPGHPPPRHRSSVGSKPALLPWPGSSATAGPRAVLSTVQALTGTWGRLFSCDFEWCGAGALRPRSRAPWGQPCRPARLTSSARYPSDIVPASVACALQIGASRPCGCAEGVGIHSAPPPSRSSLPWSDPHTPKARGPTTPPCRAPVQWPPPRGAPGPAAPTPWWRWWRARR
jgi:hypothetical protein